MIKSYFKWLALPALLAACGTTTTTTTTPGVANFPGLGEAGQTFGTSASIAQVNTNNATNTPIELLTVAGSPGTFNLNYGGEIIALTDTGGGAYSGTSGTGVVVDFFVPLGTPSASDEVIAGTLSITDGADQYEGFATFGHKATDSFINSRSGSARFAGTQAAFVNVFRDDGSDTRALADIVVNVDFSSDTLTGVLQNFNDNGGDTAYTNSGGASAHILLSGGVLSGADFTSIATFQNSAAGDFGLDLNPTATFDGAFYGSLGKTISGELTGTGTYGSGSGNATINGGFIGPQN